MFFSTASWNKGGGGKSTARNRNGDTDVFVSDQAKFNTLTEYVNFKMHYLDQYQTWVFRSGQSLAEPRLVVFPFELPLEKF